jgi:transposase
MLYDNMKQVVIKRLLKQEGSTLNRQFENFAGFYGFKPIMCRPYRGQTKGKIKRTDPGQQDWTRRNENLRSFS